MKLTTVASLAIFSTSLISSTFALAAQVVPAPTATFPTVLDARGAVARAQSLQDLKARRNMIANKIKNQRAQITGAAQSRIRSLQVDGRNIRARRADIIKRTASSTSRGQPPATCTPGTCNSQNGVSDSCNVPYTVSNGGVTLTDGSTYPSGGHVNYDVISCEQYKASCGTYRNPGSGWTENGYGTNFDPNNNQPGGKYIGKTYYDFSAAVAAFPNGYCVTWVQVSLYNTHFGEGGQIPICAC